jgi:hypothetical protein
MAGCHWKRSDGHGRAPLGGARPFHVYDHEGSHLGSFSTWQAAHDWAHLQVAVTSLPAPLEVEDRQLGVRRRVWADQCEAVERDLSHAGELTSAPERDESHSGSAARKPTHSAPRTHATADGPIAPRTAATATTVTTEPVTGGSDHFSPPRPRRPS